MVEPVSMVIAASSKEAVAAAVNEAAKEAIVNETSAITVNESSIQRMMTTISDTPLESLKAQNESLITKLNQNSETNIGKREFYDNVDADLRENGFTVIPEEGLKQGTGENRYVKPGDGIAIKDNDLVVLEKKAPAETVYNSLPSGSGLKEDYIKDVRETVKTQVDAGDLDRATGKHVVFTAQAEYNANNLIDGITGTKEPLDLRGKDVRVGYSVDLSETQNVERALSHKGIENYDKIEGKRGSVTYIYDVPA